MIIPKAFISMKFLIVHFLFALASVSAIAQDHNSLLEELLTKYRSQHLSMDMEVVVFATADAVQGEVLGNARIRKSGELYYSEYMNEEMYVNGSAALVVNHRNSSMQYAALTKSPATGSAATDLGAALKTLKNAAVETRADGTILIVSEDPTAEIVRTELLLDKEHTIRKLTYFYPPANEVADYGMHKVEIRYANVQFQKPDMSNYTMTRYVSTDNTKIAPLPEYANYTLIGFNN